MIRRLAIVTAWLLVGQAVWFAIFWGLLHVPESSVWMLALSAVLALALVAVGGAVLAGGSAAWDLTRPPVAALLGSVRHVPAAIAAVLLFGASGGHGPDLRLAHPHRRADRRVGDRAHGTPERPRDPLRDLLADDVRPLVDRAYADVFAAGIPHDCGGRRDLHGWRLARRRPGPARWLAVTFWFVLLVAIPWHLVDWRPAKLGLGAEPWFVAAKLAAIAVAMAVGWALVLRAGHGASENT